MVETLFAGNCNETPVTSDILGRQLVLLRDEGEILITGEERVAETQGKDDRLGRSSRPSPRAVTVQSARLVILAGARRKRSAQRKA